MISVWCDPARHVNAKAAADLFVVHYLLVGRAHALLPLLLLLGVVRLG